MQHFNNADVVVYGVHVIGYEGTAGMAAVAAPEQQVTDPKFLERLYFELRASLPTYALPIFLRVIASNHAYQTG